jgi:hypothetical protein
MPEFPEIGFELEFRNYTDLDTMMRIVSTVKELSYDINPMIWFGIELLSSYPILRPKDLSKIRHEEIDLQHGDFTIFWPSKNRHKEKRLTVRLVDEHTEIFKELLARYPALPPTPFFRHTPGLSGVNANEVFGPAYFRKWWKRACDRLGIEGLDLYGGTRHTLTTTIAKEFGEQAARDALGDRTNKAFERYCHYQKDKPHEIARQTSELKKRRNGKIIDFGAERKKRGWATDAPPK